MRASLALPPRSLFYSGTSGSGCFNPTTGAYTFTMTDAIIRRHGRVQGSDRERHLHSGRLHFGAAACYRRVRLLSMVQSQRENNR